MASSHSITTVSSPPPVYASGPTLKDVELTQLPPSRGDEIDDVPSPVRGANLDSSAVSHPTSSRLPITGITKWRVLSNCLMGFGNGLNDSAPGALIPYMEVHYSIGFAIVSLIFVTTAVGFLLAAPLTHLLESRLGRARAYMVAQALIAVGYAIVLCTPPYGLVLFAFFLIGFGQASALSLNNVYCANAGNGTTSLGLLHGSYGLGGIVGPLITTALVSHGILWSRFYAIALSIATINGIWAGYIFWGYEKTEQQSGHESTLATPEDGICVPPATVPIPETKGPVFKEAVKNPVTIFSALFLFAYQGAEVSISGWVISFLILYRGGEPAAVGYVTAGFWAGITIGRFVISPLAHRIGERRSIVFLAAGSFLFQLLVWLVPNIVTNAVAVAIIGLLLGPVYPCAMAVYSRLLSKSTQITSLGLASSAGSSGGAIAPLVVGLIAQKKGTWVLHPVCIGLYGAMMASWVGLPQIRKRRD